MRHLIVFCCFAALGCAADLDHGEDDAAVAGSPIQTLERDGDVVTTQVDATSDAKWIYMDLEANAELDAEDDGWDIAFQRFEIKLNGGVSGDGGVEIAALEEAFDDVEDAPEDGFITDEADGDDDNDKPDNAFTAGETGWYDYNVMSHTLSPRPFTYVVRSAEGNHFKLAILDYYDDAGTSGFLSFEWAPLEL